jgi:hypothetical protein
MRGQTTIVLIVLVLIIFAGIAIFLLGVAGTVSQVEYTNMYVHNTVLTVLRTNTGYQDTNCRLVSDLLGCAFFQPTYSCGGGPNCRDLATATIEGYMERLEMIRKSYRYLFVVEPEAFIVRTEAGEPFKLMFGDESLEAARIEKLTATQTIQRSGHLLKVKLIVAKRSE